MLALSTNSFLPVSYFNVPPALSFVSLLLAMLPLLGHAADSTKTHPLRVMSYNIRYDTERDTAQLSWENRRDKVASMMRFHGAAVIGTQEGKLHQLLQLEERLPGYEWIGIGREDGGDEFSAIFYQTDRLELLEHETFWLSDTPTTPSSTSWGNSIPRIATWARFRDRASGDSVLVLNTHFDHESAESRRKGARMIVESIEALADGAPAIVMGDFNATEGSDPYEILTSSDADTSAGTLRDALHASEQPHHGPMSTFNDFDPTVWPEERIDYVFVTPEVEVRRHGHLNEKWYEHYPSDHLPVLVELVLPS